MQKQKKNKETTGEKITAQDLIDQASTPSVPQIGQEALEHLATILEYNDSGCGHISVRATLELLQSHGYHIGKIGLNNVCKHYLGRKSFRDV